MKRCHRIVVLLLVAFGALAFLGGCGDSDAGKTADAVADEVTGHRAIQEGESIKKQIRGIHVPSTEDYQQGEEEEEGDTEDDE